MRPHPDSMPALDSSARGLALALALALLSSSGCDNPACIYGGDCFDGGGDGPLGENAASVPPDHAWLLPGAPTITGRLPTGSEIATTAPVVLYFSESMAASSLSQAFQLFSTGGQFEVPVPLLPPTLVGDGRVLLLLPAAPLQAESTYELRFREESVVYDLSGTTLGQPADGFVHGFSVAAEDPVEPRVLGTWPLDLSLDQGPTGEIDVIFDRPVQPLTVDLESFVVTVDGAAPAANPKPQALQMFGLGAEPRVWRWRSTDDAGLAAPLAVGGEVAVSISPAGDPVLALDGEAVPPTLFEFTLAPFASPLAAELVSLPTDAIGIANLDGSAALDLAVTIEDGLPDDRLGAFLIGASTEADAGLIALYREFSLSELGYDAQVGVVSLGAAELDLASSLAPLEARFADGTLDVALRLGRAGAFSAVRLLDTDLADAEPQGALLDTTRPTLIGLGPAGASLLAMRSDLRHIVVSGRASEPLRSVEVSCLLGDNGVLPPVQEHDAPFATQAAGLFVAAPVLVDVLSPLQSLQQVTVLAYDQALNAAAAPTVAAFQQVGASGPAPALPGNPTVTVEVFDAETLLPLAGARIMTHELTVGAPVPLDAATTLADGRATLLASLAGQTLVTVDLNTPVIYDLFTFQGVPTAFLSIPLTRPSGSLGLLQGSLLSADDDVTTLSKWVGDTRLADTHGNATAVQSCSFNPILSSYECVFGPAGLTTGTPGAASFALLSVPPNEFTYSPAAFLKGWDVRAPRTPSFTGVQDVLDLTFDTPLDAPTTPLEERVLDVTPVDLDASALMGLNLANLVGGGPAVTVESRLAGLGGALMSGFGVAFPTSGAPTNQWRLRAAIPGAVDWDDTKYPGDELGSLVQEGLLTGQPFLRVELRDGAGNRSVRRPRFDVLPAVLVPCTPPSVLAPAAGGGTGGASFALTVDDVLANGPAQPGLYRATLTDSNARRWRVWAPGGAGPTLDLWLPPIAGQGGTPLASGALLVAVTAVAWPAFDAAEFQWSDLGRESDVLAVGAAILLQQP